MKIDALGASDLFRLPENPLIAALAPVGQKHCCDETASPEVLARRFQELNPRQNKFYILLALAYNEKLPLLRLMSREMLFWGVSLFPKEFLFRYLMQLNKMKLINLFLKRLKLKQFLNFFPKEALMMTLKARELQKNQILRHFPQLPLEELRELYERVTKQDASKKQKPELLQFAASLEKPMLLKAMMALSKKSIVNIVSLVAEKQPQILRMIPDFHLMKLTHSLPKELLLRLMTGLEEENFIELISTLGNKDLSYVLSGLDDKIFGDIMLSRFGPQIMSLSEKVAA